ncbi:hypothetical protein DVJ83_16410 (plasmid) [Deinococcus wulumuqiensis]|uniref:NHR domain-containing protein n=1 Tax=Deinococcus wulumuqiensis TaxID=980427 RepID=A0A345IM06_9DEIO|nr:hypothetical protein [Deinococcus wulumuqiensis]AXH00729.1 hypothetical protein DVJ83_16410 [Deinococcus wulumuqiensis]
MTGNEDIPAVVDQLDDISSTDSLPPSDRKQKKAFDILVSATTTGDLRIILVPDLEYAVASAARQGQAVVSYVVGVSEGGGGYLFRFQQRDAKFILLTYSNSEVARFNDLDELAEFINHCTGMVYSPRMMELGLKINAQIEPVEGEDSGVLE